MGLLNFLEEKQSVSIKDCIEMVKEAVTKLGYDNEECFIEEDNTWVIYKGSATIFISLNESEETDDSLLRITSPLLYLPKGNLLPLFKKILEINYDLVNCGFSLHKDTICLVHERPLAGLDFEEVYHAVEVLGHYADEYDNILQDEFGGLLYRRDDE